MTVLRIARIGSSSSLGRLGPSWVGVSDMDTSMWVGVVSREETEEISKA